MELVWKESTHLFAHGKKREGRYCRWSHCTLTDKYSGREGISFMSVAWHQFLCTVAESFLCLLFCFLYIHSVVIPVGIFALGSFSLQCHKVSIFPAGPQTAQQAVCCQWLSADSLSICSQPQALPTSLLLSVAKQYVNPEIREGKGQGYPG